MCGARGVTPNALRLCILYRYLSHIHLSSIFYFVKEIATSCLDSSASYSTPTCRARPYAIAIYTVHSIYIYACTHIHIHIYTREAKAQGVCSPLRARWATACIPVFFRGEEDTEYREKKKEEEFENKKKRYTRQSSLTLHTHSHECSSSLWFTPRGDPRSSHSAPSLPPRRFLKSRKISCNAVTSLNTYRYLLGGYRHRKSGT